MKKIFAILLTSLIAVTAMAQSPVYRVGDNYMKDGSMMNKYEFKGFLKNTCPEAFELFSNGHKLSIAGWTCFAFGLAVNSVGSTMLYKVLRGEYEQEYMLDLATSLTSIGSGVTVAGVVCLSVGYTRMHKAVNLYNIEKAKRPDLRWVFGMNKRGDFSVAMQF